MQGPNIKDSEQIVLNKSFDPTYSVLATEGLGFDGANVTRNLSDSMAVKVTVDGSITYVATAAPGTAQSTAKWQAKKIDKTTGVVITFADGNSDFDNVATDLTTLEYS